MTSGFGKVILLGEHAVVYGHPALAGAIDRGVHATANHAETTRLRIPAWDIDVTANDDHPVAEALRALLARLDVGTHCFDIRGDAALPPAAGLGSSAAFAVAVTRAIAKTLARSLDDAEVADIANSAETCFHHRPSGIDVALATHGGLALFRRDVGLTPVNAPPLSIAVGISGEPRSTADMVARVASAVEADPEAERRLDRLGRAAAAGADRLTSGAVDELGPLMTMSHRTLGELGVSTERLDAMVDAALEAGALGAKLTGAGGGGAVIALAPNHETEIVAVWQSSGVQAFTCTVGVTR